MAYNTPTFDYGRATNDLNTGFGLQENANNYGRFLSQERFKRGMGDANRQFKRQFPRIGQSYQNRGMYNSGLRKQGQRRGAEDYQRAVGRAQWENTARETQFENDAAIRSQAHQSALQRLFEDFQLARASTYDPYGKIASEIG